MKNGGELTYEEMTQACKNVGVDLTCAACAAVFYTGYGAGEHTCAGTLKEQIERARKSVGQASALFCELRKQCADRGHETAEPSCYPLRQSALSWDRPGKLEVASDGALDNFYCHEET